MPTGTLARSAALASAGTEDEDEDESLERGRETLGISRRSMVVDVVCYWWFRRASVVGGSGAWELDAYWRLTAAKVGLEMESDITRSFAQILAVTRIGYRHACIRDGSPHALHFGI